MVDMLGCLKGQQNRNVLLYNAMMIEYSIAWTKDEKNVESSAKRMVKQHIKGVQIISSAAWVSFSLLFFCFLLCLIIFGYLRLFLEVLKGKTALMDDEVLIRW